MQLLFLACWLLVAHSADQAADSQKPKIFIHGELGSPETQRKEEQVRMSYIKNPNVITLLADSDDSVHLLFSQYQSRVYGYDTAHFKMYRNTIGLINKINHALEHPNIDQRAIFFNFIQYCVEFGMMPNHPIETRSFSIKSVDNRLLQKMIEQQKAAQLQTIALSNPSTSKVRQKVISESLQKHQHNLRKDIDKIKGKNSWNDIIIDVEIQCNEFKNYLEKRFFNKLDIITANKDAAAFIADLYHAKVGELRDFHVFIKGQRMQNVKEFIHKELNGDDVEIQLLADNPELLKRWTRATNTTAILYEIVFVIIGIFLICIGLYHSK